MAQLRTIHPWNPGYSIPQNVKDEPFGQGVVTTAYLPRGTISALQPDWLTEGRALEAGARAETREAQKTGLGSVGSLGNKGGAMNGSLGCTSLSKPTLAGSSLSGGLFGTQQSAPLRVQVGGMSDPIANFGREGARMIIAEMKTVPTAQRAEAMRTFIEAVDPKLWDMVAEKTKKLQAEKKYPAVVALEKALAASLANRLVDQFAKVGQTGQLPMSGLLGLVDPIQQVAALSGFWSDLGNKIKSGAKKVVGAAKSAVSKLGSLVCKVAGNPATAQVAGSIPSPHAQAAAAGASIASSLCSKPGSDPAGVYLPPPPPEKKFPIVPVAIGGAALLLGVVLLTRKK